MKNFIIINTIFFILIVIALYCINTNLTKTENKYKSKIGQKLILEKDTLIIIDYSLLRSTFTLSNNKEVNKKLIFNKK